VHHQTLLRDLGLLPINRVAAAKANPKNPRPADRRMENSAYPSASANSPKPATSPSPNFLASAPSQP
jgi:hypothetical protein